MKLKNYQEKNIERLVDLVFEQLDIDGMRRKIVFQAPTGAGKTVMMTEAMCRIHETIADNDCQYNRVAFVWIAPNALHIQSYMSMKNAMSETKRLSPIIYDEMDLGCDGYIKPGEVLFVNWQSINKEKNVMVRGSEQVASIYDIFERTTIAHNIPIVCIIDEEHMFAGEKAKQSEKVLSRMNPKLEVRISATPQTLQPDAFIKIDRTQVINEGMIKMGISLNPAIKGGDTDYGMNMYLLGEAMKKREKLAEAYERIGKKINPLLLIQLPNDSSESMSEDEVKLKEGIMQILEAMHGSTVSNGKVAVWLSGEKQNLEGIERFDSTANVLLFKQAIAMGWDCPRAAVLLIFRKLSSEAFTIQTVGRIMRMPEQRFYNDPILNTGYVYTDLSADVIKIEPDAMDYITLQHSNLRDEIDGQLKLKSFKQERSNKENNELKVDFRRILKQRMAEEWTMVYEPAMFDFEAEEGDTTAYRNTTLENRKKLSKKHVNLDIQSIKVEIPADMDILDEEGLVVVENKTGFAKTPGEISEIFKKFCNDRLNGWQKSKCTGILQSALINAMEELFDIFETDAMRIICSKQNQPVFIDLIQKTLDYYKRNVLQKELRSQKGVVECEWNLPMVRDYKDSTHHLDESVKNHALMPYYEQNNVSLPEQKFTRYLEKNTEYIEWWYKNGDSGAEHFAVKYTSSEGRDALFFVDYIIKLKNGTLCLFDTKTENSDREAPYKHNALIDYLAENGNGKMIGGIIIENNGNWKYCPMKIENTIDIINWNTFQPF